METFLGVFGSLKELFHKSIKYYWKYIRSQWPAESSHYTWGSIRAAAHLDSSRGRLNSYLPGSTLLLGVKPGAKYNSLQPWC